MASPSSLRWSRRRRRRLLRRLAITTVIAAGSVVVLLAVRDGVAAQNALTGARDELTSVARADDTLLTVPGRADAIASLDRATMKLVEARRRLGRSVPIRIVAFGPGIGYQRAGALQLIDDASDATTAVRGLLVEADRFATEGAVSGGVLPLERLADLEHETRDAARVMGRVDRGRRSLWGPLGDGRVAFDSQASSAQVRLSGGADAMAAARTFAGANGPRRYFIAGQNNAEMRDQGMVLSYGVLAVEGGRFRLERAGPIGDIDLRSPAPTTVPPGTASIFGGLLPTQQWRSVNATADFAWSGRAMVDMYKTATGEVVDGVIALDVPALAGLLEVTGPVTVPGLADPLSAEAAPRYLLSGQYDGLGPDSGQEARREQVALVAGVVVERLRAGPIDPVLLARRMGDAAAGRHLQLFSTDAAEEGVFEQVGLGGGIAGRTEAEASRTFHVSVQEAGATKLDWYVRPSIKVAVSLQPGGTAVVRTTVTVRNDAPVAARASYALGPNGNTKHPGQYICRIYFWGPAGASQSDSVAESGLNLTQKPLLVEPGQSASVTFETLVEDAVRRGRLELRLVPQPRHVAVPAEIELKAAGWRVTGDRRKTVELGRTATVSFEVRR